MRGPGNMKSHWEARWGSPPPAHRRRLPVERDVPESLAGWLPAHAAHGVDHMPATWNGNRMRSTPFWSVKNSHWTAIPFEEPEYVTVFVPPGVPRTVTT